MLGFSPSDATIVRRTTAGLPQAFEALVFRYQRQAHAVARARGLRPAEVEDAVQEAFLQAFRDLHALREPAAFGGWFLNIVRHVAAKELRRRARGEVASSVTASPLPLAAAEWSAQSPAAAEALEQGELREHVWRRVAELPRSTREAILLFYYEGESLRAVARALGLSLSGAKRRLHAGREALREKLWRTLQDDLRHALPGAREWSAMGRRLAILIAAAIPAAWGARALAGSVPPSPGGADATARWSAAAARSTRLATLAVLAKSACVAALVLAIVLVRSVDWSGREPIPPPPRAYPPAPETAAIERISTAPAPSIAATPPVPASSDAAAEIDGAPPPALGPANHGSVLVRALWGDDRTPAAGVSGNVVPWGSPDLYVDERAFTTGADGTALVDGVFKGGASVLLDRGGVVQVKVLPGEELEAVVEVPHGFNVEGTVVDLHGAAVPGARVWISSSGHTNWGSDVATAGPDGSFSVRSITSARYMAARAPGHAASDLRELKGDAGSTVGVRLVLNGAGAVLPGVVRDPDGAPVPRAKVMVGAEYSQYTLHDDGVVGFSPPPFLGFTEEDGVFRAESLPMGRVRVAVRAGGFVPLAVEVDVAAETEPVELIIERGGTLSGRVTSAGGEPVTGAQVVVGDFRAFLAIKVFSGEEGWYRLTGIAAGTVEAHAARPGVGKSSATLAAGEREDLRWDPVLARDAELRGRLRDHAGDALSGFTVILEEALGEGSRKATAMRLRTDDGGRFHAQELSDVAYRATVLDPGSGLPCLRSADVRPGAGEVELRLESGALEPAFVHGRILDAGGEPFAGAKVICYSALGGYGIYYTATDTGEFRAGPLPAGSYSVEVQARGRPRLAAGEHVVAPGDERHIGDLSLQPSPR